MIRAAAILATLLLAPVATADPAPLPLQLASAAPARSALPAMALPDAAQPLAPREVLFGLGKRRKGAVCGDRDIKGVEAGDIAGTLPGCGAKDAVRVHAVAGVRLSQPALMTCKTAAALKRWVSKDVETAFGRRNKVVSLRVAAHYACRTRNNRPGAKISEHGRGKAIDISGFTLTSGETITVYRGWQDRKTRRKLRKIWRAACGPFGTVLGPEADRYHLDHFHLDVARHRSGAYCR